jgi:hypothetical protein
VAVADRFTKLGFKRNQQMNCETFIECIYSDFHSMEFLTKHMESSTGDNVEDLICANWAIIEQAAENKNCSVSSLQLIRVAHKLLSVEEAEEVVEAALRALSAMQLAEGLPPLDLSVKTPLPPGVLREAVADRYGREESIHAQTLSMAWSRSGRIKINPSLTRKLYAAFIKASRGERETEIGNVYAEDCETRTQRLDKNVLKQVLLRKDLGATINFSFPEYFILINENYDTVFYPMRNRK